MKYALFAYIGLVAVALTLKPAPASKGPECGPGVLCLRTQKQVQAVLAPVPPKETSPVAAR